jgi:acetyl-CoA carboxylase biotin carboxyl carrier protein
MKISNDELYGLVKKLSELDASEITVRNEDLTIKIKHSTAVKETNYIQPNVVTKHAENTDDAQSKKESHEKILGTAIHAPINGTFYCAPGPDEPPYVKAGDKVKKGSPVCILEAMKMMNTINMPEDGMIISFEAQNEDIVDTGQALVIYEAI